MRRFSATHPAPTERHEERYCREGTADASTPTNPVSHFMTLTLSPFPSSLRRENATISTLLRQNWHRQCKQTRILKLSRLQTRWIILTPARAGFLNAPFKLHSCKMYLTVVWGDIKEGGSVDVPKVIVGRLSGNFAVRLLSRCSQCCGRMWSGLPSWAVWSVSS
jgi:hypothetical protein